jgi:hypothetical protein
LIVPEDQYFVVGEDYFPSGSEPLDLSLKTSQQGAQQTLDRANPAIAYEEGWGWWWFDKPRIYDDRIRWMAEFLPAGTYQLSYQLQPLIPGEYQIIPAHAYQYYFPDVQGRTSGSRIKFTD